METVNTNSDQFIDISVYLKSGMVHWPSDPAFKIERISDMDRGDRNNLSVVSMGVHSGTHIDAPVHFIKDGKGIDVIPFEATIGSTRVIEIEDTESIKPNELMKHNIQQRERVLFKTQNSSRCWKIDEFIESFVYIPNETAKYLVSKGVMTVGVDYLSVGGYKKDGTETHRTLLNGGIWLIEGLNLSNVQPGGYELICLPLKILGGDGAPARAVLRMY